MKSTFVDNLLVENGDARRGRKLVEVVVRAVQVLVVRVLGDGGQGWVDLEISEFWRSPHHVNNILRGSSTNFSGYRSKKLDHLTNTTSVIIRKTVRAFTTVAGKKQVVVIDTLGDISARTATLKSYCVMAIDVLSSTSNELFVATSRGSQKVSGG